MGGDPDPDPTADALAVLTALRKIGAGIDGYRRAVATHLDLAGSKPAATSPASGPSRTAVAPRSS